MGASVRPVVAVLGPENPGPDALKRARIAADGALRMRGSAILELLQVCEVEGRVAWVYEDCDALSLQHTLAGSEADLPSARAAAEIVAAIAEVMVMLAPLAHRHPGPEPADVLVDEQGGVVVAGFAGPFPPAPAMRAPNGAPGQEPSVVYRLGVLLAHLVSGVQPGAAQEEAAHAALVRRALIRAMARPGPVLTERYGDWLRGMLAWDPHDRPPLSAVPAGLRKVAEALGGPSVVGWAAVAVPRLRVRIDRAHVDARAPVASADLSGSFSFDVPIAELDTGPRASAATPAEHTQERRRHPGGSLGRRMSDDYVEDDPTQEAASQVRPRAARPARIWSQVDTLPVGVGPPPEAVPVAPRLPRGFLDSRPLDPPSHPVSLSSLDRPEANWRWLVPIVWAVVALALVVMALVFTLYLVVGGERAPQPKLDDPGPSLSDVLPDPSRGRVRSSVVVDPEADTDPLADTEAVEPETDQVSPLPVRPRPPLRPIGSDAVLFRSADPHAIIGVTCAGQKERGEGQVWFSGLQNERCVVSADLGRGLLKAEVVATGPAKFVCFRDGAERCEPGS